LKIINEYHNKIILNLFLHEKINARSPVKKYTVLRETLRVTAQILKDVNDDDGVYLTTVCYIVED